MGYIDSVEDMSAYKAYPNRSLPGPKTVRLKAFLFKTTILFISFWFILSVGIGFYKQFLAPPTPNPSYPHPHSSTFTTAPINHLSHFRHAQTCPVSSTSILTPITPLCKTSRSLLEAASNGGRIGFDAPYIPRGCGIKWYTTKEVCEVLGRWGKIAVTGDSMMRHLVGALNVLVREDLGFGAVTDWNFSEEEKEQCFCLTQFNVKSCSVQGIYKTSDVEKNDPSSLACGLGKINLFIEQIVKHPIPPAELNRLITALTQPPSNKPTVLLYGMGLWNDLSLPSATAWLDEIENELVKVSTPATNPLAHIPRLFITPNAAGKEKLDSFILKQGDKQLQIYEEGMKALGEERGMAVLGTWNATIQVRKWDGVHVDLRGNLWKAMVVINWLDLVWKEKFT